MTKSKLYHFQNENGIGFYRAIILTAGDIVKILFLSIMMIYINQSVPDLCWY